MTNQEAAGVINNVVDSLRSNPLVIGLLVLNVGFMGAFVYMDGVSKKNTRDLVLELLRDCIPKHNMYPPQYQPQQQPFAPQSLKPPSLPGGKTDRVTLGATD